jgi:glycosyltransferase involved in cell wall biosynthesis
VDSKSAMPPRWSVGLVAMPADSETPAPGVRLLAAEPSSAGGIQNRARSRARPRKPVRTVVQVTWSLVAGGSEMYALKLAANLDPVLYSSFICAMDQGGALEDEVRRSGIPYRIMNRKPTVQLAMMWRLFRLFRQIRASVVQTHHFNQLFYSALAAKVLGARLIHTEHSVEYLKARRFRIALRLLSMMCDDVVAIGDDGARVLREHVGIPARKLRIIRAGINPSSETTSKRQARRSLGLSENDKVAVIVARLYPEKNHLMLLEAFAKVLHDQPSARLLIVGEGTEQAAIASHIQKLGLADSVNMLGVRRDVDVILAACDLFVLSSDREGLPIAVLEAMAMARPVVATSVGDLSRVVVDGVTGRLVEPGQAEALAHAMSSVLGDESLAIRMGEATRAVAIRNFSLDAMITKFQSLYSD